MERTDPADPTPPMESTEPIDPTDKTELREPMDRTEFRDQSDHREPLPRSFIEPFFTLRIVLPKCPRSAGSVAHFGTAGLVVCSSVLTERRQDRPSLPLVSLLSPEND